MLVVNRLKKVFCMLGILSTLVGMNGCTHVKDYSGHYVNTQGTDVVYDELKIELSEDGTYRAEIVIYRLTTVEGTAIMHDGMLLFEDTVVGVKGDIQFEKEMAVFTVTKSNFEYIGLGESFEFTKSE